MSLKDLISLLATGFYSIDEIAKELNISEKTVLEWLKKIKILAKRKGWELEVIHAYCKKCGYVFKEEIINPTKCPRCKSEWIEKPKFRIKLR